MILFIPPGVWYLLGFLLLLIACTLLGFWLGNRPSQHTHTVTCRCGSTDLVDKKYWIQCNCCGEVFK